MTKKAIRNGSVEAKSVGVYARTPQVVPLPNVAMNPSKIE
jgi:hypothetical protein